MPMPARGHPWHLFFSVFLAELQIKAENQKIFFVAFFVKASSKTSSKMVAQKLGRVLGLGCTINQWT